MTVSSGMRQLNPHEHSKLNRITSSSKGSATVKRMLPLHIGQGMEGRRSAMVLRAEAWDMIDTRVVIILSALHQSAADRGSTA